MASLFLGKCLEGKHAGKQVRNCGAPPPPLQLSKHTATLKTHTPPRIMSQCKSDERLSLSLSHTHTHTGDAQVTAERTQNDLPDYH